MTLLNKKALDGHVETIILSVLIDGTNYGYALVKEINRRHEGLLALGEGTIYPVLYRMEEKGVVASEVQEMPSGRNRKYYRVTENGRKALAESMQQWNALSTVMASIKDSVGNHNVPETGIA